MGEGDRIGKFNVNVNKVDYRLEYK